MKTRLMIGLCGLVLLAGATTAEARNRLLRVAQPEPIPEPQLAAPAPQELLAPAQRLLYRPAQKLPAQKVPLQRAPAQKVPTFEAPLQSGVVYQKGHAPPHIRYVQHCPLKASCCGCASTVQATLTVQDPRTCCLIDVPVCLPGCCRGQPAVHSRGGILMRGVTGYQWACGYRVRVVVGHHGDVVVHYFGR